MTAESELEVDILDYMDLVFRENLHRAITPSEAEHLLTNAGVDFVDDGHWPRNLWVEAIAEAFEITQEEVLSCSSQELKELRDLWDIWQAAPPDEDAAVEKFLERASLALFNVGG